MPNWCSNNLQVEGNPQQLKIFIEKTTKGDPFKNKKEDEFTLDILYPTPQELMEQTSPQMYRGDKNDEKAKEEYEKKIERLQKEYGHTCWYNWRTKNWGTKWDACDSVINEIEEASYSVSFQTAWAPPVLWLEKIAPEFPELKFRLDFIEEGMQFCGVALWDKENGYMEQEGELTYADEDGKTVVYDSEKGLWKYEETGEFIEDEDFSPNAENSCNL